MVKVWLIVLQSVTVVFQICRSMDSVLCGLFHRVRHDGQNVVDCITKCYCRISDLRSMDSVVLCGLFHRVRHNGQNVVDCITKCYCRVSDLLLQRRLCC